MLVASGAFVLALYLFGPHKLQWFASVLGLIHAAILLPRILNYWELRPDGLLVRQERGKWLIPWQEVTRVANWPAAGPGGLQIDYARPAPFSHRGTLYATPGDREGFLAELKRHAPDAEFEA